jgi:hypothetical protein
VISIENKEAACVASRSPLSFEYRFLSDRIQTSFVGGDVQKAAKN